LLGFLPLISNSVSARFVERGDDMAIVLTAESSDAVLDRFPVFYCAAAVVRLLHLLSAEALELSVHIAWPQPTGFAQQAECLAARLCFDAPLHHIVVRQPTLQTPCRFADPIAYQTEWAALQSRMASLGLSDDVVERIRGLLDMQPGLVSIEEAAALLHMSVSTLKRRLAEAGTGYREVRESVLRDRAFLLLTDATLSLESIASALGYSDLANFSHAFKRWTDVSPGSFRRNSLPVMG
jgi:AraC-like DNA-binding protein